MAIAIDNATPTPIINNPVTSQTTAFTTAGSDRFLSVFVLGDVDVASGITGMTYAGVALTKLDTQRMGADRTFDIWYLANPAVGSNNLVISRSTSGLIATEIMSHTGTDQTTPIGASSKGEQAASTSFSRSLTTLNNNSWGVLSLRDAGTTQTPGAGLTLRATNTTNGLHYGDSNAAISPAGSHTFNSTASASVTMAWIMFELKAVSAVVFDQTISATAALSASMLTPKTIVQAITANSTVSASVAMVKSLSQTLSATATATANVLKGLSKTIEANASVTASMLAQRAYLVTLDAAVAASATIDKALQYARTLGAQANVTADVVKAIATSVVLNATTTVTASLELVREIVLTAAVSTSATMTTAIGKSLDVVVSVTAKILAPFWRTKYPAHGDGEDYEIKYPHD